LAGRFRRLLDTGACSFTSSSQTTTLLCFPFDRVNSATIALTLLLHLRQQIPAWAWSRQYKNITSAAGGHEQSRRSRQVRFRMSGVQLCDKLHCEGSDIPYSGRNFHFSSLNLHQNFPLSVSYSEYDLMMSNIRSQRKVNA
jgi:hypothetical protein